MVQPALQVGQQLGDYEIVRLLRRGGMGEVYEARQGHPTRPVALKVLAPWLANDPRALKRFWQEAEVPARLDHPNIVRIFATDTTPEGIAYYTMQLVQGLSLAQLILHAAEVAPVTVFDSTESAVAAPLAMGNASSPVALREPDLFRPTELPAVVAYRRDRFGTAVRLGVQVARALAWAHSQKVMHRDLKPANIMVDQHDHVYLVDFGLTRLLGPEGETSLGAIRGTPWYMSPEQARGEPVDARVDLFALGVTLYELASGGQGPYTVDRGDTDAVLEEVRAGRVLPLRTFAADMPVGLVRLIERTMHPVAGNRYQTADELARELEALQQQPGGATPSADKVVLPGPDRTFGPQAQPSSATLVEGPPRPPRRRWLPLTLAAGIAAGLLGAVLYAVLGPHGAAPPEDDLWAVYSDPLPAERGERKLLEKLSLFRADHRALWASRLLGQGRYSADLASFTAFSPENEKLGTFIALDDPRQRWFEYEIEIQRTVGPADKNHKGVFFGWHRHASDPSQHAPFFSLRLNDTDDANVPNGRLEIDVVDFEPAAGARAGRAQRFPPPIGQNSILLPQRKNWHRVRIRVQDHLVTITADGGPTAKIDVRKLRQHLAPDFARLEARGGLGVWAQNGFGRFRNASVAILPSLEDR